MAYSELIKNFDKIRDYMREFYVYGFKSRDEYTRKSARSYDDERRRVESWLGDYMSFRQTPEGRNVFISVDNRNVPFNPLNSAWKAKSFTNNDIILHFYILDLLADGEALSVREIIDGMDAYSVSFDSPLELDVSTVREKLKEYEQLGLLRSEKRGREMLYSLADERVDEESWADAAAFFSEAAPLGVIGSYLLDRLEEKPAFFNYKHHYLLHTLDSQIMYDILCAMKENRCIDITSFNTRREAENEHRVFPVKFYISTQTGREYLLAYCYRFRKLMFFRLDTIRRIRTGPYEKGNEIYRGYAEEFDENLWGVSLGTEQSLDHVEMTVHVEQHEQYVVDRLKREKRHGGVERIDESTFRFIADVYDAGELVMWARTFLGRVVSFESSNQLAVKRFYDDIEAMRAMYGAGGDAE